MVTDPAELYFKQGVFGWYDLAWRRQPLLFGYSSVYAESAVNTEASAGWVALALSAVPANTIRVVHTVAMRNDTTAAGQCIVRVRISGVLHVIALALDAAPTRSIWWSGTTILAEGDYVVGYFGNCAQGDDLAISATGCDMQIY